jgi:hypothetical protein
MASVDHEADDPVRAFADKPDAEAFARHCTEYDRGNPKSPEMDAPDAEWDAWQASSKAWEAAHPAGRFSQRDYYVCSIPLVTAAPAGEPVAWATTYEVPATTTVRVLADMNERQRAYVLEHAQKVVELVPGKTLKDRPTTTTRYSTL